MRFRQSALALFLFGIGLSAHGQTYGDNITGGTCPAGQVVSAVSSNGTITCITSAAGSSSGAYDLASGSIQQEYTAGSALTQGYVVTTANNTAIPSAGAFGGVVVASVASGGTAKIAISGLASCYFVGAATLGDIATTNSLGQCVDSGYTTTDAVPLGTPIVGQIKVAISAAGLAPVQLHAIASEGRGGIATTTSVASAVLVEATNRAAAVAASIPLTQKGTASGVAPLDINALVPAANSRVSSVNGKTGAAVLNAFDLGAIKGPAAGGPGMYNIQTHVNYYAGVTAYASGCPGCNVEGFATYMTPAGGSSDLQIVFPNTGAKGEAVCGAQMSVRASIVWPIGGTPLPLFFNGQRDVVVSPCGTAISDPLAIDTTPASPLFQVRWQLSHVSSTDTTPFIQGWNFGYLNSSTAAAVTPYEPAGFQYDGFNMVLPSTTITDAAMTAGQATLTSSSFPWSPGGNKFSIGETIVVTGAGAGGANLTTTIAGVNSVSSITLAAQAGTTVSGASATISPTDKTLLPGLASVATAYYTTIADPSYLPSVALGTPTGTIKTVGIICDSRCAGYAISGGGSANQSSVDYHLGPWPVQALDQADIAAGYGTTIMTAIPYLNVSMTGDTAADLGSIGGRFRRSLLGRTKFTLGAVGVNDLGTAGDNHLVVEASLITLSLEFSPERHEAGMGNH